MVCWDTQTGKELFASTLERPHRLYRLGQDVVVLERIVTKERAFAGFALKRASTGEIASSGNFTDVLVPAAPESYPESEQVTFVPGSDIGACIVNPTPPAVPRPLVVDAAKGPNRPAFPGEIVIFRLSTGKALRTIPAPVETGPVPVEELNLDPRQAQARALALSPDGKQIAALSRIGTITIWTCADGKVIATLPGASLNPVNSRPRLVLEGEWATRSKSLVWAADAGAILTLPSGEGARGARRFTRWDVSTATQRAIEWSGMNRAPNFATCSPDLMRALVTQVPQVSGSNRIGGLEVVDLSTGAPLGMIRVSEVEAIGAVAYSADSTMVALATGSGSIVLAPMTTLESFARDHRSLVDFKSTTTEVPGSDK